MWNTNISEKHRQELLALCEQVRISGVIEPHQVAQIENFISSVKYGLRFEKHEERVDRELRDNFPVFIDVKDKEINNKPGEKFNFLLEGDNLHSLKLLEKTHKGKIDVIYIDPPYNTGNEFVYNDKIVSLEDGYRHSKWLSFIEQRLTIARNLLSSEGVIFISIDDNEQAQLKLLCDSIFGAENFLNTLIFKKSTGKNDSKYMATLTEYVHCYKKDTLTAFSRKEIDASAYKYVDDNGAYALEKLDRGGLEYRVNCDYEIECPDGSIIVPGGDQDAFLKRKSGNAADRDWIWRYNKERFEKEKLAGNIVFKKSKGHWSVYNKRYNDGNTSPFQNIYDVENNAMGNNQIKKIFGSKVFSFPKPLGLLTFLINLHPNQNALVLDFFAGSGTTGHAVLELNKKDNGNRRFILCTNNENNICEQVTYQRLKTVITGERPDGSKYSDGIPANLKYFKCDLVNKETEDVDDVLMEMATALIELENHIDASDNSIAIIYDEEELDELLSNFNNRIKHIYVSSDIATTGEQEQLLASKNVQITEIPHHYYKEV